MNKKIIQSITSAIVILMLVGIAVGYSYTNTGFRSPWFATDDGTFNTSTGTVNISAATGVLPNASIPSSAFNKSIENQYALRATGGNGNPIIVERAVTKITTINTNYTIANITFNDNYASFFIDINLVAMNAGGSSAYVSAKRFISLSGGTIGTITILGTDTSSSMNYYFANQPSYANTIQVIINATAATGEIYQGSVKVVGSNGDGSGTEGIVIEP